MKTQLLIHLAAASALAETIVEQPRLWLLILPSNDGVTQYDNVPSVSQALEQYPGSAAVQGMTQITLVSLSNPAPVANVVKRGTDNLTGEAWSSEPYDIAWMDQGVYDPMIEATASIARLEETEIILREEMTRQASLILELEQRITNLNAAIDAAQQGA